MLEEIEVYSPTTLEEAYVWLDRQNGRARVLAGGTDLMVQLQDRSLVAPAYLNIWGLEELRGVEDEGESLRIGALTTYTQLIYSVLVQEHCPILVAASRTIGGAQIQNRGTLGGNIVNASPAGDTLPILAVFEAELELGSLHGVRRVLFNEFYTGYRQTVLASNELLLAVHLPKKAPAERLFFQKVGSRQAMVISKVVIAARAWVDDDRRVRSIQIAAGSVAPTVIRLRETEALLRGRVLREELIEEARENVMREVRPITDMRSTEEYRRWVSGNLVAKFLRQFV
jgi:CO/xanthine dehydrogenase FAD-binding subunit